jgi:phytoene synthase
MTDPTAEASEWSFPNRATPFGTPVYYAVRFSPDAERQRNALLIAWYELTQGITDRPLDPGVARLKLDWWREELDRTARGRARHPLAVALQACRLERAAFPLMQGLIDAAEARLRSAGPADDAAFAHGCRVGFGGFFRLLACVEPGAAYPEASCIESGAYCAAVEQVRHLGTMPHRLPPAMSPTAVGRMDAGQRRARFDALLQQFAVDHAARDPGLPALARKLTRLTQALHQKMRARGYPVTDTLIDRAPIAHLWTAWRCR